MTFFSLGGQLLYFSVAGWLAGWIWTVRRTDVWRLPWWGFSLFKIRGAILLFFIWPYIVWATWDRRI